MGDVVSIRPQRPAVSLACRWHETFEIVTATNMRIACAWQRMLWRAFWGI